MELGNSSSKSPAILQTWALAWQTLPTGTYFVEGRVSIEKSVVLISTNFHRSVGCLLHVVPLTIMYLANNCSTYLCVHFPLAFTITTTAHSCTQGTQKRTMVYDVKERNSDNRFSFECELTYKYLNI